MKAQVLSGDHMIEVFSLMYLGKVSDEAKKGYGGLVEPKNILSGDHLIERFQFSWTQK